MGWDIKLLVLTIGQAEVSNREIKRILEKTVSVSTKDWAIKLDEAPIGLTPFHLVYGKSCHLPVELEHKAYWALKYFNFDQTTAGEKRKIQLHELEELRLQAYESSRMYKERMKLYHDKQLVKKVLCPR